MEDLRTDAPQFDLTSIADEDGEDALQATLSDSVAGAALESKFSIDPSLPMPAASAETSKPQRSGVQLADERFLAAFVGAPVEEKKKPNKSKAVKPAAATKKPTVVAVATAAAESLAAPAARVIAELADAAADLAAPPASPEAAEPKIEPAAAQTAIVASADPEKIAALVAGAIVVESRRERRSVPRISVGPLAATEPVTVWEPEILPKSAPREPGAASLATVATAATAAIEKLAEAPPASATPKIVEIKAASIGVPVAIQTVAATANRPAEIGPVSEPMFSSPSTSPSTIPAIPSAAAEPARAAAATKARLSIAAATLCPPPINLPAEPRARTSTGAWWTLPLMFVGLTMIACALIVPVADENHRAAYELAKIERDVVHFQDQSDVNQSFLARVSTDPALAERLAMRQLNMIRPDEHFAALKARHDAFSMSPFALVSVDAPAPMPAYRPVGGFLSRWFMSPRFQIYFVGLGILLTAAGVVFGGGGRDEDRQAEAVA